MPHVRCARFHECEQKDADKVSKVSSGLIPDGRHFASTARDQSSQWRSFYKTPIPTATLASHLGNYVQNHTLYTWVRPFGITAIVGGWDSESELPVDGQVGDGPKVGSGGKVQGVKAGGPGLYMIEPSGLYWVRYSPKPHQSVLIEFTGLLWCSNWEGPTSSKSRIGETRSLGREPHLGGWCQRSGTHNLRCP